MRIFELNSEVEVTRRTVDVFPFFSDAFNLERLTPPWLRFQVVHARTDPDAGGTPDRVPLTPPRGAIRWISEIMAWNHPIDSSTGRSRAPTASGSTSIDSATREMARSARTRSATPSGAAHLVTGWQSGET